MSLESENLVLLETDSSVATITINRAAKRNAINPEIIQQLDSILGKVSKDDSIRVVILRGDGEHFSAGADLNWMKSMAEYSEKENFDDAKRLASMLHKLNELNKPVIGVIQGCAFGGAVGIAACCDITIASDTSKYCLSEVKLGLSPAVISPFVVSAIGEKQSRRYMLTAEVFSAIDAYNMGLVNIVAKNDRLDEEVNRFTKLFLESGPNAISSTKDLIFSVSNSNYANYNTVEDYTASVIAEVRVSDEAQEGTKAFFEKRKPNWA